MQLKIGRLALGTMMVGWECGQAPQLLRIKQEVAVCQSKVEIR